MGVKYRLKFSKGEPLKFISHLDLLRLFNRSFRRGKIGLKCKGEFNPQPRLSYALALPLGSTSSGEFLEVELEEDLSTEELVERLSRQLPQGISLKEVYKVPEKGPSLTSRVKGVSYRVKIQVPSKIKGEDLEEILHKILSKEELWITRHKKKGKKDINLRSFIKNLKILSYKGQEGELGMELKAGPQGSIKPVEVLELLEREVSGEFFNREIHREIIELEE